MITHLKKTGNLIKLLPLETFILVLFSLSQIACQPKAPNKRIIVASAGKIESLDPAQANTLRSLQLINALGDTLFKIDSNGSLKPHLAKDLPQTSNKGLTIDISLRENVLFHDGTPFNANAMVFSLKRFMRIGTLNYLIKERVKDIEAPKEFLLRIHLRKPSSSLKKLLTSINLTPISPKAYSQYNDKFLNKDFVGTGPYKLTNFQPNKQRIEPFGNYWGNKPLNDGIDYISFNSSTSLFSALKSKEVDVLLSNSVEDVQRLALSRMSENKRINEGIGPAIEIGYITFKSDSEPLKSNLIRTALLYSLDRDLISQKVSYGMREPVRSIVPKIINKNSTPPWPKYDPSIARDLLIQSGYCNNNVLTIPLTFRTNVPADKLLALTWKDQIRNDLSDCINITLNGVESVTVYKQLEEGIYNAIILDWTGAYPDPEAYLAPLLSCKRIINNECKEGEAVYSGSFWSTNLIQQYLEESENLSGIERLIKLNEIETIAAEGAAYLPIWVVRPKAWSQKHLSQPEFDRNGLLLLNKLKKKIK